MGKSPVCRAVYAVFCCHGSAAGTELVCAVLFVLQLNYNCACACAQLLVVRVVCHGLLPNPVYLVAVIVCCVDGYLSVSACVDGYPSVSACLSVEGLAAVVKSAFPSCQFSYPQRGGCCTASWACCQLLCYSSCYHPPPCVRRAVLQLVWSV